MTVTSDRGRGLRVWKRAPPRPLTPRPLRPGWTNPGRRAPRPTEWAYVTAGPAHFRRPWGWRAVAHARLGGHFTRGGRRGEAVPRAPPQASASEFPPGAASKVRARPLLPGVGDLTFRARMGKFAVFAGPLERPCTQPCVDVEKYVCLIAQMAPLCPVTSG